MHRSARWCLSDASSAVSLPDVAEEQNDDGDNDIAIILTAISQSLL
jgi:hypothetical protein